MNNKIQILIKIIFVILVFYYLYQNNHFDKSVFTGLIEDIPLSIFLIFLILLTLLLGTLRWYLILKYSKLKISFLEIFKIIYICSFFNNFMFGNIGGDVLRVYYAVKLSKQNKIKNGLTIFVDRFLGFLGLIVLGFISFSIILIGDNKFNLFFSLIIIFLFSLFFLNKFFFIIKKNKKLKKMFNFLNLNKKLIFYGILISVLLFITVHLTVYFISNNIFNFKIELNNIFFANFISSLMGAIPLTPGGMGISEASFVFINQKIFKIYLDNLANILIYYRILIFIFSIPSLYFFIKYKNS